MRSIICLGGGWQQCETISAIKNYGYYVIVVDPDKGCEARKFADEYVCADISDINSVIFGLALVKTSYGFEDVISINTDIGAAVSSELKSRFGLDVFKTSKKTELYDKSKLKLVLDSFLGSKKRFQYIIDSNTNISEIQSVFDKMDVIVKPIDAAGSRGVFPIKKGSCEDEIFETISQSISYSKKRTAIVEELIIGDEYSVEVVNTLRRGIEIICISRRYMEGFTSARRIENIDQNSETFKKISRFIIDFIQHASHKSGLLHIELIIDLEGSIHIIDIGERGGGYWVADKMVTHKLGMNLNLYYSLISRGLEPKNEMRSDDRLMLVYSYPGMPVRFDHKKFEILNQISLTSMPAPNGHINDACRDGIYFLRALNE